MKTIFIVIATMMISACASTNKLGSVVIQNDTDQVIYAKARFLHDHTLGSTYSLQPHGGAEIARYDIAPGTEKDVLIQLAEMQLTKTDCEINLDNTRIEKLSHFEQPGLYIRITQELFERCIRTNKPGKTEVVIETMEG